MGNEKYLKPKRKALAGDVSRALVASFRGLCAAIHRKVSPEVGAAILAWLDSSLETQAQSIVDAVATVGACVNFSAQVRSDIKDRFAQKMRYSGYRFRAGIGGVIQLWLKTDEETRNRYRCQIERTDPEIFPTSGETPHVQAG